MEDFRLYPIPFQQTNLGLNPRDLQNQLISQVFANYLQQQQISLMLRGQLRYVDFLKILFAWSDKYFNILTFFVLKILKLTPKCFASQYRKIVLNSNFAGRPRNYELYKIFGLKCNSNNSI